MLDKSLALTHPSPPLHPSKHTATTVTAATPASTPSTSAWVPVLKPEDLPKGDRREVRVDGAPLLLFWYRNQIYAIDARSPAEGAYSEGFMNAKLTQDGCIECPTTKTLFSLATGAIVDWYPTNPVLRFLTPRDTVRPLGVYPVKLTQDAICVDVGAAGGAIAAPTRGGADSSIDRNNVYALQPRTYSDDGGAGGTLSDTAGGAVTVAAFVAAGAAGTAVALYKESTVGLVVFWVALVAGAVAYARRSD